MSEMRQKTSIVLIGGALFIAYLLLRRPDYLTNPKMLGAMIIAEIVLAALCIYRKIFFGILVLSFLFAGTGVPFEPTFLHARWYVLGLGAVAGLAIYMKDRRHYFNTFHLVAIFCVLSALVSSMVSRYPEEAFLKTTSLLMLFVYCGSGARIAVPIINPEKFFGGILIGCEALTYLSAVSYFVVRWGFYGSANSLGVVMGVVIVPLTLWGLLTANTVNERRRRGFALLVAMLLLMSSLSRASIGAAVLSSLALCIALRKYRLIFKGAAVAVLFAIAAVMIVPAAEEAPKLSESESVTSLFLYKGKQKGDFWASRKGPWSQTWDVIKDHPWFGSGYGTSLTGDDLTQVDVRYQGSHLDTRLIREHGNSYLAITEWVGLVGVIPFYFLVVLTALNVRKAFVRLYYEQNVYSPIVPAAAVVLAGLMHAAFEDWMFAVGYYVCVFFWAMAFILVDMLHTSAVIYWIGEPTAAHEPQQFAPAAGQ